LSIFQASDVASDALSPNHMVRSSGDNKTD